MLGCVRACLCLRFFFLESPLISSSAFHSLLLPFLDDFRASLTYRAYDRLRMHAHTNTHTHTHTHTPICTHEKKLQEECIVIRVFTDSSNDTCSLLLPGYPSAKFPGRVEMLRLSLRRWCTAAISGSPTSAAHGLPPASTLPDFYGKSFAISPRAWAQITRKNSEEGFSNDARYLRLAIDSGGCHGYIYKFSFETNEEFNREEDVAIAEVDAVLPSDEEFTGAQPSPRVVVDTLSASKLENATLDYHSELKGSAFVVVGNELVDESCACAMSFSIRKKERPSTAVLSSSVKGAPSGDGGAHVGSEDAAPPASDSLAANARPISRRSTARTTS
ncbi:hypothetical protein, conserved [Leishmania tarentolae]|uniref:FeS cluster biogenesis domain-containing protein n=1 Tax=Leishmania tarentolae TaxID=5689 RepID=A0A640KYJ9_LEITA|nr:hypothetical protein, conserved [Leishmania tarentolae]